jgi:hypothetical protein
MAWRGESYNNRFGEVLGHSRWKVIAHEIKRRQQFGLFSKHKTRFINSINEVKGFNLHEIAYFLIYKKIKDSRPLPNVNNSHLCYLMLTQNDRDSIAGHFMRTLRRQFTSLHPLK